jgi:hypothetical protein
MTTNATSATVVRPITAGMDHISVYTVYTLASEES